MAVMCSRLVELKDMSSSVACMASSRVGTRIMAFTPSLDGVSRLQQRQSESGSLAGSGLGLCYYVVGLFEQFWNCEFLNRGRALEPFGPDGFEHVLVQPQSTEIV